MLPTLETPFAAARVCVYVCARASVYFRIPSAARQTFEITRMIYSICVFVCFIIMTIIIIIHT